MVDPVRIGIVGLGSIGVTHARVLAGFGGEATVVAASGGPPGRLAEAGFPDAAHVGADEVIAHPDVDVVVICSPSGAHGRQTLAALRAGKHVVVEKPLAVTVDEAAEAVRVAADRGRLLTAIAQRRLEPQHVALRALLSSGALGRPVLGETFVHWHRDDAYYAHAPWRPKMAEGGGSLMNQGLHNVDLLNFLLGPVTDVTAQYATLGHDGMEAEDTTVATLRFASGALGLAATSTATPPGDPARLAIYTSGGTVELTHADITRWEFSGVDRPAAASGTASGAADPAAIGLAGHRAQWRDILDALRDGRPPAVTGEDACDTVRLLCAIYESARTGRTVTV